MAQSIRDILQTPRIRKTDYKANFLVTRIPIQQHGQNTVSKTDMKNESKCNSSCNGYNV